MPPMARGTSVMRRAFCQVFTEPPLLCRPGLGKLGAVTAIEEVDEQADDQPDEEAIPGDDGQAGHEQEAEDDAERGNDGPAGNDFVLDRAPNWDELRARLERPFARAG